MQLRGVWLQTLTLDMHRYAMNLAKEHFHSTKLVLTIGNTDTFPDYSLACGDGVPSTPWIVIGGGVT